ncbi:hypothetical protein GCM10010211_79590 [Streptomyces albospinus]|uniref:Secreted protein n=1 Tax=Streptomyces albospinus TaxID=285515 RepID=A0ABQ2VN73_9ACTN|nr:hypothetical protein [Streptomyces albospinus]GGV00326.1 hypothetical protein GCM10010211_79590 [Streptomyces albospinus]
MRRTTTVASASAAVLCLGVLLTGCGGAAGSGYAAVGAQGPSDGPAPNKPVPPRGGVELTPLDGNGSPGANRSPDSGHPGAPGSPRPPDGAHPASPGTATPSPSPAGPGATNTPAPPGDSPRPRPSGTATPAPPSPTLPTGPGAPAGLLVGRPALTATDVRWCQQVTLDFLNTGDRPVTSGIVTFGTHVIGALGIDWATISSDHKLPLPLAPGRPATGTWRVCVDAWRVPLGMHLDTEDVTFTWQ